MKIPSFVKTPNHRRFSFEPRYYDAIKEDIDKRRRLIAADLAREEKLGGVDPNQESYGERISSSFRRKARQESQSVVIRVVIVAMLLVLVAFFLL